MKPRYFYLALAFMAPANIQAAAVSLKTGGDAVNTSSFNSAGAWSVAATPSAGNTYSVAVQFLRTPVSGSSFTFAGDSLSINTSGGFLFKGTGTAATITVSNFILNGGLIRSGSGVGDTMRLAGGLSVTGTGSEIRSDQSPYIIDSVVTGTGALIIASGGTGFPVTFNGTNTYTGNLTVSTTQTGASTILSSTSQWKFAIGANGINNNISGTGKVTFNGAFNIDLTGASTAAGSSWNLVTVTGTKTYGATFSVTGFTSTGTAGSRFWLDSSGKYYFSEATGTLYGPDTDADADGLKDTWEITKFGSIVAQSGADDFDGDFATNLEEQTAGTDPTSRTSSPDTDGDGIADAWETAYGLDPTTSDSSLDSDSDGFTNLQEFTANTSPIDSAITPSKAKLTHRWSFNGDLSDSVGGSTATRTDSTGTGSTLSSKEILLNGGAQATAAYINLGSNLLKGKKTPVTLELWATEKSIQSWARVFDFGSGTTEYLTMSWNIGTTPTSRVEWKDATTSTVDSTTNPTFVLNTEYHIVMTIEPGAGTNGKDLVTWYAAPVGSTLGAAKGSFSANNTLQLFNDTALMLGRSQFASDNNANASYDEFRIWDGALTSTERDNYQTLGPDALDVNDADNDGLPDSWEVAHFGDITSQDGSGDPDADLYTNAQEFAASTDPLVQFSSPDSDADGLPDGWETAKFGNLTQTKAGDPDGDGATNGQEFADLSNPADATSFVDSNADGIADGATLNAIDTLGTTSFNTNLHWDDSSAPGTGTNYLVPAFTYGNGLRTPEITGDATFAGAKLVLANGLVGGVATNSTLVVKTTGVVTIPYLGLDGALINQAAGATMTLAGNSIRVTRTSELWANNGAITVTAPISGSASLNITTGGAGNVVTLSGANTLTGNLNLTTHTGSTNNGTLTLASTGSLSFAPTATGFNNAITGTGTVILNGAFNIDLSGASSTAGNSWNLVTVTGTKTYGATFNIPDFTSNGAAAGSRIWTKIIGETYYQFSEATSTLSVINPDTDADGMTDSWEVANFGDLTHDGSADTDSDGATDFQEFVAGTNPNDSSSWPDSDGDGVKDTWELATFGNLTTATISDTDGDGMADDWENTNFGGLTQTKAGDFDGDGASNGQEYADQSNPADNTSFVDSNADGIADGATLNALDAAGTTSFNTNLHWDDSSAPATGINYLVPAFTYGNGLRTPLVTGDATFAGAKLVLANSLVGGVATDATLVVKTTGVVTIPYLGLDGVLINHAATNAALVTLAGNSIRVTRTSEFWANNGAITVAAPISGNGNLNITGINVVTLSGTNTLTGNLNLTTHTGTTNNGTLTLASTGSLTFAPTTTGVSNAITGTGTLALNGTFNVDLTGASSTVGDSWNLVTVTGTKTYGTSFSVSGATSTGTAGSRVWTKVAGANYYQFDEATGALNVVENPDSDADGMIDTWEVTNFGDLTHNGSADTDGDGSTDLAEYSAGTNPNLDTSWPDTDADGLKDSWEVATFGNLTTATITDKDGDGLADAWETFFFGSIATQNGSDDSDSDGFTNEQEEGISQPMNVLSTPTDVNGDGIADFAQHTLKTSDLIGTTSFDAALNWTDATAPAANGVYIVPSRDFRTPVITAGATNYTFAGAKLDLIDVGAGRPRLLLKYDTVAPNSPTSTFAQVTLNGAEIQNAAMAGVTHRVAGSIVTQGPLTSYLATNNGPLQVDAVISGNAPLSMTGNSRLTLSAVNTYTGNTTVNAGGLTLGTTGSLAFSAGANGVNNAITGTGAVALDGAFAIDTTSASTTAGATWDLITTSGSVTIGSTFTVTGYTADSAAVGARKWTSGAYEFDEATGVLTVLSVTADTIAPVITRNGNATVSISVGDSYTDAGATATDNVDSSVTVNTTGSVNTAVPGTYTLTYTATDNAGNQATPVTRTVTVSDTTAPVITLSGNATVSISAGTSYTDAGATATDNVDSSVTVNTTGSVNTAVAGTYTLTYSATDAAGNVATPVTRTVTVTAPTFSDWTSGYSLTGANAAADADPDKDGIKNSVEYVLGGNPTVSDAATIAPTGAKSGSNYVYTFKRTDVSEANTTVSVDYGNNLSGWTSYSIGATTSSPVAVTENGSAADTVVVTIPNAGAAKFFARLKVVAP